MSAVLDRPAYSESPELDSNQGFIELFEANKDRLYRHIMRFVRDPHLADDILQEVYLGAFVGFEKFVPENEYSFYAWIRRISTFKMVDARKKREKSGIRMSDMSENREAILHPQAPELDPESFRDRVLGGVVETIKGERGDDKRTDMVLRKHLEGESDAEIAPTVGKSRKAVHMAVRRGLEALRKRFAHIEPLLVD